MWSETSILLTFLNPSPLLILFQPLQPFVSIINIIPSSRPLFLLFPQLKMLWTKSQTVYFSSFESSVTSQIFSKHSIYGPPDKLSPLHSHNIILLCFPLSITIWIICSLTCLLFILSSMTVESYSQLYPQTPQECLACTIQ